MLTTLFATFLLLAIAIVFHEFGHFIVAKCLKIRVEQFSIGFPPRLFGMKIGETDYCVSAVPLGGYVKVTGQDPTEELTGEPYEFNSRPPWQRMLVVVAGPLMNVITAYFMIVVALMYGVPSLSPVIDDVTSGSLAAIAGLQQGDKIVSINDIPVKSTQAIDEILSQSQGEKVTVTVLRNQENVDVKLDIPKDLQDLGIDFYVPAIIGKVLPNTPASRAGLKSGDEIISVNGQPTHGRWNEVTKIIRNTEGKPLDIQINRKDEIKNYKITGEYSKLEKAYLIGITVKFHTDGVYYRTNAIDSFNKGFFVLINQVQMIMYGFKEIIVGNIPLQKALGGPQSIANIAGQSMRSGGSEFLLFTAAISIMLGIINLLPIPVLDGGHILFHIIEWIRGKALTRKTWEISTKFGFAVLLTLMVFVIINDLIGSGFISRIFNGFQ